MKINMKLSIIVPVYNEEKTLAKIAEKVFFLKLPDVTKEIIFVNDASQDNSWDILNSLKAKYKSNWIILSHKKNKGKGAAIRTALYRASGDHIIIQDSDLEYNPEDILLLINKAKESGLGKVSVFGSRNLHPARRGYFHFVLGVAFLTFAVNSLYRPREKLTDVYTCYKLIPTELLKSLNLKSNGFEIEAEITAKLLKSKNSICEVPISYRPRRFNEGKKIKVRDGLKGLSVLVKNRFL